MGKVSLACFNDMGEIVCNHSNLIDSRTVVGLRGKSRTR